MNDLFEQLLASTTATASLVSLLVAVVCKSLETALETAASSLQAFEPTRSRVENDRRGIVSFELVPSISDALPSTLEVPIMGLVSKQGKSTSSSTRERALGSSP